MAVDLQVLARRGSFVLDVALAMEDGELVALMGSNGSGKSTLLETVAGLIPIESGTVVVGGSTLTSTEAGLSVPVPRRRIGFLGQEPLLFPHLTILENVAFGLRSTGVGAEQARARAAEWLEAVELAGFEHRRPSALSGGQQQRAAIARALAPEPELLLLDEPMASLDVESASVIRGLLRRRLEASGTTTILVTHDAVDAVVLADRVVILEGGRVVDEGEPPVVLGRPVNRFAAALAGLNLVSGVVGADGTLAVEGETVLKGSAGLEGVSVLEGVTVLEGSPSLGQSAELEGRGAPADLGRLAVGSTAFAAFPRRAVTVGQPGRPGEAARPARAAPRANSWTGTVANLEPAAGGVRISVTGTDVVAEVPTAELLEHRLTVGAAVELRVDPAFVTIYPDRAGGR
jgi:molybdate transport system ATP-binding protein